MLNKVLTLVAIAIALTSCATGYRLVQPGVNTLGSLRVSAEPGWNVAPSATTPGARSASRTWTRDGLLLDRLMIIPSVENGESLFRATNKSVALPAFRSDMLPNEIEELVESSIVKEFGEGNAAVNTSNLRPQSFGRHGGFLFDIEATVTESPTYRGVVGGFVDEDKLYLSIFLAATPHYYEKNRDVALASILSMSTSEPTIGRY